VKIAKRALGLVAATGLVAGGLAFLAPPSGAVVLSVGACSNTKALGTIKSTTVGKGLTDADNRDASVSAKGIDPTVNKGTNLGACLFDSGRSTPDNGKPITKNSISGTGKSIAKWSLKLFSVEADCNTADTGDNTEWPLSGAIGMTFGGALNNAGKAYATTGYVAVDGFTDPDNDPLTPSDVVEAHGIVTKGVAAGADIASELYFDPVLKDKLQTTATPHFGYNFDLTGALGCTTPAVDDANILAFVAGDGTSLLLALPAAGTSFTIGTP
jgi:hypothetical protein